MVDFMRSTVIIRRCFRFVQFALTYYFFSFPSHNAFGAILISIADHFVHSKFFIWVDDDTE